MQFKKKIQTMAPFRVRDCSGKPVKAFHGCYACGLVTESPTLTNRKGHAQPSYILTPTLLSTGREGKRCFAARPKPLKRF